MKTIKNLQIQKNNNKSKISLNENKENFDLNKCSTNILNNLNISKKYNLNEKNNKNAKIKFEIHNQNPEKKQSYKKKVEVKQQKIFKAYVVNKNNNNNTKNIKEKKPKISEEKKVKILAKSEKEKIQDNKNKENIDKKNKENIKNDINISNKENFNSHEKEITLNTLEKIVKKFHEIPNSYFLQELKEREKRSEKYKAFTSKNYIEKGSKILIKNYGGEMFTQMTKLDDKMQIPYYFMERHKVLYEIRTKMVDWMIEVIEAYHLSSETFFQGVFIMDCFIYRTPKIIKTQDIHELGLTCMFIATKYQDINPFNMNILLEKIGHNFFNR
jgi:hypothetical protein